MRPDLNAPNAKAPALSLAEFEGLMQPFAEARGRKIAVATSGGADSMALTLLLQQWAAKNGASLQALTVDHGLRAESRAEARQVGEWLSARGIVHEILSWEGAKPSSNIQNIARAKRYELLRACCVRNGAEFLFLAHHLADQAETFLLRLARGSGLYGLAAMRPFAKTGGIALCRPLLEVPKERLIAYLETCRQQWIEDPSNENEKFDRIKLRKALPFLESIGLSAERLALAARNLSRARDAVEDEVRDFIKNAARLPDEGYALLELAHYAKASPEVRLRGLAELLKLVSGSAYTPRLENLEGLDGELLKGGFKARTLSGCLIQQASATHYFILREAEAVQDEIAAPFGGEFIFDDKWAVRINGADGDSVRKLGEDGWKQLLQRDDGLRDSPVPYPARLTLPSLWRSGQVVAAAFLYRPDLMAAKWRNKSHENAGFPDF